MLYLGGMMNIHIKSTNFVMTPDIESLIKEKTASVEKFLDDATDAEVLVEYEVERSTHHKKGDVFRAEANLTHKGSMLRAQSTKFDVRVAIDDVRNQLEKQIRRSKKKRSGLFSRGARAIKNMLRKDNV